MNTVTEFSNSSKELQDFREALKSFGVHGALGYLNKRTPHRFTGIYKFDGDTLRNVALFDSYDPTIRKGEDAPMEVTYCSLVKTQERMEINDANEDERVKGIVITPVISYCGVLIRDLKGEPFGTLCSFDMKRCQERSSDISLLEAAGELLFGHLFTNKQEINQ